MALTAAETAQKELDKALADVEKKEKLRATCTDRVKQAIAAAKAADAELQEAKGYAHWLALHPAILAAVDEFPEDGETVDLEHEEPEPVAEPEAEPEALAVTEESVQPLDELDDLFAS